MPIIWLRWRGVFFLEFEATEEARHVRDLHRGMTSRTNFLVPARQDRSDGRRDRRGRSRGRGRLRGRRRRGLLMLPGATESEDHEHEKHHRDEDRCDEGDRDCRVKENVWDALAWAPN